MQVSKRHWTLLLLLVGHFSVADEAQTRPLRDPTQPLDFVAQKATQTKLELQAVFIRGNSKEAVISGKQVGVGGKVLGAEILAINEKSVVYRREGTTGRLQLRDNIIDKR